jgi:hypothetical protein
MFPLPPHHLHLIHLILPDLLTPLIPQHDNNHSKHTHNRRQRNHSALLMPIQMLHMIARPHDVIRPRMRFVESVRTSESSAIDYGARHHVLNLAGLAVVLLAYEPRPSTLRRYDRLDIRGHSACLDVDVAVRIDVARGKPWDASPLLPLPAHTFAGLSLSFFLGHFVLFGVVVAHGGWAGGRVRYYGIG